LILTPERWKIIEDTLVSAWELPESAREPFLIERCGPDTGLAAEIRSLLQARNQADCWSSEAAPPSPGPRRFGAYQLEKMIARGGMGAVYLAHRADGEFDQKVAIKIIGLPFEIEPLRQRFRQERQILAGLNHPHIAHLIDGGVTEDGELYLAMEHIDGLPLDEYVRNHTLSETARLDLFRKIADAVGYAHRNLVVHRDLKPSNILVTDTGAPKLLDFGTAKLLSPEHTQGITATNSGFMTVAYASPEQLRGKAVTTLSDVYSLGAILYEMLAGRPAFPAELALRLETLSKLRFPPLAGDLDLIVRKSLDPEPERRYASAQELSADLERYVRGRPMMARPATWVYRTRKFVQRNKVMVTASILVLIASGIGAGVTLWQANKAQNRFNELRDFVRFVMEDLNTGLQQLPGSTALQRLSVERSLRYLDRLANEAGQDDSLTLEVADGYRRLGDVLGNPYRANLGDRKQAEQLYRKGLAMALGVPTSNESRRIAAELEVQLAGASGFGGAKNTGITEIRRAAEELRSLSVHNDVRTLLAAARAWEVLGTRLVAGGGNVEGSPSGEAAQAYRESIKLAGSVPPSHPEYQGALLQLAQCEMSLGLLKGSTKPVEALEHYRRSTAFLDRIASAGARSVARRLRASVLSNAGWAEGQAGLHADAVAHLSEAAEILKTLSDVDPGNTNLLYSLTGAYRALGIVEDYRKHRPQSVAHFRMAADVHSRLIQRDPTNKVYRFLRGEVLVRAGNGLVALGKPSDAFSVASEGLTAIEKLAAATDASLSHTFGACRWLTETQVVALRDGPKAASFCRKALDATGGTDPDAYSGLALALEIAGDRAGAARELEKALALLPPPQLGQPVSRQRSELEAHLKRFNESRRTP
jgi:eukaryotic-like serine/threonine-protein kinase